VSEGNTKAIPIDKTAKQVTKIGSQVDVNEEKLLTEVLLKNKYLFAWTTTDMSSIHPEVMVYKLTIFK